MIKQCFQIRHDKTDKKRTKKIVLHKDDIGLGFSLTGGRRSNNEFKTVTVKQIFQGIID